MGNERVWSRNSIKREPPVTTSGADAKDPIDEILLGIAVDPCDEDITGGWFPASFHSVDD
ncbi:MAG TPA: hypothetical protein DCQ83_01695 [Fibrobacteres bacterium]|jgi:hypothetical protein|nr:hypothetical protein [Fibrobacterota bacterium]